MKVCTDACMLGAWFAEKIDSRTTILDIGSGTGLLMMMLAQKSGGNIHGIEINPSCFKQLRENISQNNWKERLQVFQGDVRSYSFTDRYDFIITNPPFFDNNLPSQTEEENIAKHSIHLTLQELIRVINKNLSSKGTFGILLPFDRCDYFNEMSEEQHFYLQDKLIIRHTDVHPFTRAILHYSRKREKNIAVIEMSIRENEGDRYTKEFVDLLKDYYLYL